MTTARAIAPSAKQSAAPPAKAHVPTPQPVLCPERVIQRKCACGGGCPRCQEDAGIDPTIQTRLMVGPIGDRYEQEADRVSSQIMRMPEPTIQRQAALDEEEEEERIQMKPVSTVITPLAQTQPQSGSVEHAYGLTSEAAAAIEERRGGSPLPKSVRRYMEPRFAADFSGVRVHSGPQADYLNRSLHAHAFTYGRDIWLGAGESVSNLPLIAHELTHVLQQSPSLMRSPRPPPRERPIVQRKNIYFSLPADFRGKGSGTKTGDYVYGEIAKENENAGLLFEVRIPGAKKGVVATFQPGEGGVVGRADFFKASTTIGVTFEGNDPDPVYLESHPSLRVAGTVDGKSGLERFEHAQTAAPIGKKLGAGLKRIPAAVAATCPALASPAVCRIDSGPTDIGLGDLKPSDEAERLDGVHQLNDYIAGIKLTANKVAAFAMQNPTRIDPAGKSWKPSPGKLGKNAVKIPDKFKHPSTAGKKIGVIRYRDGKPDYKITPKPIPAYVYVVPDPEPGHEGIWMYEWEPVTKPADVTDLKQKQESALAQLNGPVIKEINTKPEIKAKRKPGPAPALRIQRKKVEDKFNFKIWSKDRFKVWKDNEAKPYLGSPEKKKTEFVDTLVEIKKRSLPNLALPTGATEVSAGLRKIQHWNDHGNTFGRLRGMFGGVYVKFVDLYEKARDRFRKLLPKTPKSGGGGLTGTLIRVGIKILKFAAHFIIGQVAERLTEGFRTAAQNVIQNLFGKEIAEFEKHIESVGTYITDLEELVKKEVLATIEDIIKPYKEHIETIQRTVAKVSEGSNWVNRIKWLVRGVSCLAPPALGCLWGFFGTMIAEAALSEMAESCWFRQEVMYPVLRKIDFVKELPARIADFVLKFLIDLLPGKAKELIGDVSKEKLELNDADACKDLDEEEPATPPKYLPSNFTTPTPEQLEYFRLLERWEVRKGNPIAALGELLRESGASPNLAMSMERLKRIDQFLENINGDAQAIRNYIKSLEKGFAKKLTLEQVLDYAERSILRSQPTVILEAPPSKKLPPSEERRRREGVIILEW